MRKSSVRLTLAVVAGIVCAARLSAADLAEGLKKGTPDIKSISTLSFGPEGIVFVGDPQGGAIFAIDTGDTKATGKGDVKIANVNEKIASLLGIESSQLRLNAL